MVRHTIEERVEAMRRRSLAAAGGQDSVLSSVKKSKHKAAEADVTLDQYEALFHHHGSTTTTGTPRSAAKGKSAAREGEGERRGRVSEGARAMGGRRIMDDDDDEVVVIVDDSSHSGSSSGGGS